MEIPSRNTIFLQGIFFDKVKTVEDRMISESQECSLHTDIPHHVAQNITIPSRFKDIKSWREIKMLVLQFILYGSTMFYSKAD